MARIRNPDQVTVNERTQKAKLILAASNSDEQSDFNKLPHRITLNIASTLFSLPLPKKFTFIERADGGPDVFVHYGVVRK